MTIATLIVISIVMIISTISVAVSKLGADPHTIRGVMFSLLFFYIVVDVYFALSREDEEDCDCIDK